MIGIFDIIFSPKAALFSASFIIGGLAFSTYSYNSSEKRNQKKIEGVYRLGNIPTSRLNFDGELRIFGSAENPVDLCTDRLKMVYVLSRDGTVFRASQKHNLGSPLKPYYKPSGRRIGSAIAVHPGFLDFESPGFGKIYIAVRARRTNNKGIEYIEEHTHQEVIYELDAQNPMAERFQGGIREVMRVNVSQDFIGPIVTQLEFDNAGHLFIGVRDAEIEEKSLAADLNSVYGKVLRITPIMDDTTGNPYQIPEDNPFANVENCRPELWCAGLRFPHSLAHDPYRNWLTISDSGKDFIEEVNISKNGTEFFGWNFSEGSYFRPLSRQQPVTNEIVRPFVAMHRSSSNDRIVGGTFYRGLRFPHLDGKLVFGTRQGDIYIRSTDAESHLKRLHIIGRFPSFLTTVKEGLGGEIFFLCEDGRIYELGKKAKGNGTKRLRLFTDRQEPEWNPLVDLVHAIKRQGAEN